MNELKRESMVFYYGFYDAVKDMPGEKFKKCVCAILEYGFMGKEVETNGVEEVVLKLAKPVIDASVKKREAKQESGRKGGAPKGNRNAAKKKITESSDTKQPKTTKNNLNVNENVNVNENANVNENENVNADENVNANANNAKATSCSDDRASVHVYGEYENVYLTDAEKETLYNTLGKERFCASVAHLSRYIKRKPQFKSSCHFEDLRGWVQDAVGKTTDNTNPFDFSLEDIFEKP